MSDLSRKDIGVTSLIIIMTQVYTAFKSSDNISDEIRKLKRANVEAKTDRNLIVKKIDKLWARLDTLQFRFSKNDLSESKDFLSSNIVNKVARRD